MLINQPNLETAYLGFYNLFLRGFQRAAPWWAQLAMEQPSLTAENRYFWWGAIPKVREWISERKIQNLSNRVHAVVNKDWELTLGIPRNQFEDDTFGMYAPQIENIGYQFSKLPDDLLKALIQAGTTTTCWDGQFFFDTDHPVDFDNPGAGTYRNLRTPGFTLTPDNYATARADMMTIKDESGREMGIIPTHLIFAPGPNETKVRQLLTGEMIANASGINAATGSSTNVWKGTCQPLMLPELANEPLVWYLADLSKPVKPFIRQVRKPVTTTPLINPSDPNLFWRKEFIYGGDSREAVGYTLPHLIYRCEG